MCSVDTLWKSKGTQNSWVNNWHIKINLNYETMCIYIRLMDVFLVFELFRNFIDM